MTTKDNSICNECYWKNQCGEDEMTDCKDFDRLKMSQYIEDKYISNKIEQERIEYYQEYQDYLDYINNDNWRNEYVL